MITWVRLWQGQAPANSGLWKTLLQLVSVHTYVHVTFSLYYLLSPQVDWTGTHVEDNTTMKKLLKYQGKALKSVKLFYDYIEFTPFVNWSYSLQLIL